MKKSLFIMCLSMAILSGCGRQNSYTSIEYATPKEEVSVSLEAETTTQETEEICVSLLGEVVTPGVYILPKGSRVYEVINMAGGLTENADVNGISLASVLEDEMQIIVPGFSDDAEPVNDSTMDSMSKDGRINLNTATLSELMSLPGIGEVRAQSIIDFREKNGKFKSTEDIMLVSGIKESSYEKIKDQIFVK